MNRFSQHLFREKWPTNARGPLCTSTKPTLDIKLSLYFKLCVSAEDKADPHLKITGLTAMWYFSTGLQEEVMSEVEQTERKGADHDQIKERCRLFNDMGVLGNSSLVVRRRNCERHMQPLSYVSGASLKREKNHGERSVAAVGVTDEERTEEI